MRAGIFVIIMGLAGLACPANAETETATRVVRGFSHPESVLIDGQRRFVSNLGAMRDPFGHDGDGFISELDADGRIVALRAFPREGKKLDSPKGMAVLDGRLYVADINRVVGFDLATREQVFEARVPGDEPTLLNDMVVAHDAMIVSDTLRGKLYRVDIADGAFTVFADGLPGANGVAWDAVKNRILINGVGADFAGGDLFEVNGAGVVHRLEHGPHGLFDGIAVLGDGRIVVSDWLTFARPAAGAITIHAADGSGGVRFEAGLDIHGPADFAVDEASRSIWIPAMVDNEVVIAPFGP